MKDLTLCIACVILGIILSMMFKQACGCKQVVEGFNAHDSGEVLECLRDPTRKGQVREDQLDIANRLAVQDPMLFHQYVMSGDPNLLQKAGCY